MRKGKRRVGMRERSMCQGREEDERREGERTGKWEIIKPNQD